MPIDGFGACYAVGVSNRNGSRKRDDRALTWAADSYPAALSFAHRTDGPLDASYLFESFHRSERTWLSSRVDDPSDVDDILGNAYLKAHQALDAGQVVEHPASWFRRIVRNCWVDMLRYRHRRKRPDAYCVDIEDVANLLADPDLSDRILDRMSASFDLDDMFTMASLSPLDRDVLLRDAAGYDRTAIASASGVSPKRVTEIRRRALEALRALALESNV